MSECVISLPTRTWKCINNKISNMPLGSKFIDGEGIEDSTVVFYNCDFINIPSFDSFFENIKPPTFLKCTFKNCLEMDKDKYEFYDSYVLL